MKAIHLIFILALFIGLFSSAQTTKKPNSKTSKKEVKAKSKPNDNTSSTATKEETIKWLFEKLENKIRYETPSYDKYYSKVSYSFDNNQISIADYDMKTSSTRIYKIDFSKIATAEFSSNDFYSGVFLKGSKVLYNGVLEEYFDSVFLRFSYTGNDEILPKIRKAFAWLVELKKKENEIF